MLSSFGLLLAIFRVDDLATTTTDQRSASTEIDVRRRLGVNTRPLISVNDLYFSLISLPVTGFLGSQRNLPQLRPWTLV